MPFPDKNALPTAEAPAESEDMAEESAPEEESPEPGGDLEALIQAAMDEGGTAADIAGKLRESGLVSEAPAEVDIAIGGPPPGGDVGMPDREKRASIMEQLFQKHSS